MHLSVCRFQKSGGNFPEAARLLPLHDQKVIMLNFQSPLY
jgi:hypothetical protein